MAVAIYLVACVGATLAAIALFEADSPLCLVATLIAANFAQAAERRVISRPKVQEPGE